MYVPILNQKKSIWIDIWGLADIQIQFLESIKSLFETHEVYKKLSATNNLQARPFDPLSEVSPDKKGFGLRILQLNPENLT